MKALNSEFIKDADFMWIPRTKSWWSLIRFSTCIYTTIFFLFFLQWPIIIELLFTSLYISTLKSEYQLDPFGSKKRKTCSMHLSFDIVDTALTCSIAPFFWRTTLLSEIQQYSVLVFFFYFPTTISTL